MEAVEVNIGKTLEANQKSANKRLSIFSQWSLGLGERTKVEARLVHKDGSYHVDHVNPPHGLMIRFKDSFHFLLELKWRWILLGSTAIFPLTWVIFAAIYYGVAYMNGDFDDVGNGTGVSIPCVENAYNFADMLLFSIESQTTVGYGFRYPNSKDCPWLVVALSFQLISGSVLVGCICGIVWARLVRPERRGKEVLFSQNAVINQSRNGQLCLSIRISDIAGNHLNNLNVRMYFVEKKKMWNSDKEMFAFRLITMSVYEDSTLLLWPSLVTHVIDEHSPLYGYSKMDMERSDFELITVVEGSVEATGLTAQTRTSYLPQEILWGSKFMPMNFIGRRKSKVKVHYREFDNTCQVDTPVVSAKKLDELLKEKVASGRSNYD